MPDFYAGTGGLNFFIMLLFNFHLIAFSYFFSFIFTNPKSCISMMPIVIIVLIILPAVVIMIVSEVLYAVGVEMSDSTVAGILLWGVLALTPHGALLSALLNTTQDFSEIISNFPPLGAVIGVQFLTSILFLGYVYYTDIQSVAVLQPQEDPRFNPAALKNLDEDVQAERERTISTIGTGTEPLRVE
eukprot:Colp12_sorted_trinity150504_noHs@31714